MTAPFATSPGLSPVMMDHKTLGREIADEVDLLVRNGEKTAGKHCEKLVQQADAIAMQVIRCACAERACERAGSGVWDWS